MSIFRMKLSPQRSCSKKHCLVSTLRQKFSSLIRKVQFSDFHCISAHFPLFLGRPGIYLEDLYVRESARGRGVGEALLRQLAQRTLEIGGGRLEWAVLNWNEPAIGFYQKMGAAPLDEWTTYRVTGKNLQELAEN